MIDLQTLNHIVQITQAVRMVVQSLLGTQQLILKIAYAFVGIVVGGIDCHVLFDGPIQIGAYTTHLNGFKVDLNERNDETSVIRFGIQFGMDECCKCYLFLELQLLLHVELLARQQIVLAHIHLFEVVQIIRRQAFHLIRRVGLWVHDGGIVMVRKSFGCQRPHERDLVVRKAVNKVVLE